MNENYNTPNSGCCGRPMHYDATPKCNYNSCCMNEYAYKQKACIRNKQPDCEAQAVIPSITVETVDGITNLANCLVHVTSTNTTYYVDDKHRIMITWAGPVNIPGYDMEGNPEGFKDQIVTDTEAGIAVIYDKNGIGYTFGIQEGLDLQEEINNKLDEMAEDGTLADIIWQYWRVNGTGITTKHNIYSDGDNKTDYWVTFIPRIRPDGEINELKQHLVGQEGQSLTGRVARPSSVARNNGYKLCINSATFIQEAGDEQYKTNNKYLIQDGVQIPTNGTRTNLLCIMNDGTLKHYDASNMTAQQLIDAGVKYSLTAFYTVIEDGNITAEIQSKEDWTTLYQRQVIAQDAGKNIYIFTCDGKNGNGGNYNVGMNMQQVANLLLDTYDVTFAFMLDGGGSTSTVVDGIVLNQLSDNINRDERYVPFMLYVEDDKPQSIVDTYNAIGQEIDYLKKEIWDTSYCVRSSNNITESAEAQADRTVMYYRLGGGQYTGSDLPHNDYKYSIAEVITRDSGSRIIRVFGNISNHSNIAVRHCVNNVWSGWTYITESDNTTLSLTSSYGSFTNDTKTNVTNDVATVAFRLDLSSAVSANNVIVSGLKGSKVSNVPVIAWDNNNSTFVNLKLTYDGTIVATANIASNASLRFNFSYLTK